MSKKINYTARTFDDFNTQLNSFTKKYYPEIYNDFNDAAVGQWFKDLNSAIGDDLSFYTDRMFTETQLDYAQYRKNLLSLARTNQVKIPGNIPAIVEAKWTCFVPIDTTSGRNDIDYTYAPILHRGTQASGGGYKFELIEDLNFAQQFNADGVSDRSFTPHRDSSNNNSIDGYYVTKTCIMYGVESKIYKQSVGSSDVKSFMEVVLPDKNVVSVNSILIKDSQYNSTPALSDFLSTENTDRWYEVDNLIQNKIFTDNKVENNTYKDKLLYELTNDNSFILTGSTVNGNTFNGTASDGTKIYSFIPSVGEWSSISQKFMTEYTDNGYCKIIFGGGNNNTNLLTNLSTASDFGKYYIAKLMNNTFLGEIPDANTNIFVYYTIGDGTATNIAVNTLTNLSYVNMSMTGTNQAKINKVRSSLSVTNTIPSISGRGEFSNDEIRYLIKYNNSAQNRCVTINDYKARIMLMSSKFGAPYKFNVYEENNKIMIPILGLSYDGTLSNKVSQLMIDNLYEYLSEYSYGLDYLDITAGKVVNLKYDITVSVYNSNQETEVSKNVALVIADFNDTNNHKMGDELNLNDLRTEIYAIDGVKNITSFKVYNVYGGDYSTNIIKQSVIEDTKTTNQVEIDIEGNENVLYSDENTMFEIKKLKSDIIVTTKYNS